MRLVKIVSIMAAVLILFPTVLVADYSAVCFSVVSVNLPVVEAPELCVWKTFDASFLEAPATISSQIEEIARTQSVVGSCI